jgi:hypothetical protein
MEGKASVGAAAAKSGMAMLATGTDAINLQQTAAELSPRPS